MDIRSVLVYLLVFLGTCVSSLCVEYLLKNVQYEKKSCLTNEHSLITEKKLKKDFKNCFLLFFVVFFVILTVSIPSTLAALRGLTVGFDINTYITKNFSLACNSNSLFEFYNESQGIEFLFAVIMYLSARKKSLQLLFFIISVLAILPFYMGLLKLREKASVTFSLLLFCFFQYNFSLSGMRQSIAMSILFWAWSKFICKEYKTSLLLSLIAVLFHSSSSIAIALLLIMYFVCNSTRKNIYIKIILLILPMMFLLFSKLAIVVSNLVYYLQPRYSFYIKKYSANGIDLSQIMMTEFMTKTLIFVTLFFLLYICRETKKKFVSYILIIIFLGRYFNIFCAVFYESTRIQYHFDYYLFFFASYAIDKVSHKKTQTNLALKFFVFLIAFSYWIYFIMYIGAYGTNFYIIR